MASPAPPPYTGIADPESQPNLQDVYALFGHKIIHDDVKIHQPFPVQTVDRDAYFNEHINAWASAMQSLSITATKRDAASEETVGIIGAGPGGLYTALILLDLGVPFKVIEARGCVGGRLYTHTFPNKVGEPFNYFDVGAMRFPEISAMRRLFHLFHYPPLNRDGFALSSSLKPYIFANNSALLSYNDITVTQGAPRIENEFRDYEVIGDTFSRPYVAAGAGRILTDVIKKHALGILDDFRRGNGIHEGLDELLRYDSYSARAYMITIYRPSRDLAGFGLPDAPLTSDVVNWIETFESSTGSFDRAYSELVLESVAFGFDGTNYPKTKWHCVSGGASFIADTMHKYISSKRMDAFVFNKYVTGIKAVKDMNGRTVGVDVSTAHGTQRFAQVISTIPLPVLRTLDLSDAGLRPMQSNALRQLNYGPSVKIGMQFLTAWWTLAKNNSGQPINIVGGQTYSDSPLGTVVYPSYGQAEAGQSTVLIASYTWTEDAERLAGLIPDQKGRLEELVIRELARIHNVEIEFLRDQLIETFPWSWSQDSYTLGAFAFFGPGKFKNVYTSLTDPAVDGRLHFAGEALSTHHAWVEGALDSAWRAGLSYIFTAKRWDLLDKFFRNWGKNGEWVGKPTPYLHAEPQKGAEENTIALLKDSVFMKHILMNEDIAQLVSV